MADGEDKLSRTLPLALFPALAACASVAPGKGDFPRAPAVAAVEVVRDGSLWTADFEFADASPVWAFHRSGGIGGTNRSWRAPSWTVETPGVRLERRGWYDVLVAADGSVPRRVRVRFQPFSSDLETSYDPALVFTDGSVALYSEQFSAFPLASVAAAEALPIDLDAKPMDDVATRVTFIDRNGDLFHAGRRERAITLIRGDTYVLFGNARPVESEAIATIIDPELPAWLRESLNASTLRVLDHYAERLGPRSGGKPMLMVSWAGPTKGRISMGGSVLPGLVLMTFEGDQLLARSPEVGDQAGWFVGHEAAHFWLGQEVAHASPRAAWITEGGADLLAVRAFAAIDPGYDPRAKLQDLLDECVLLSAGKAVSSALERGEHRAYYACGAMFGLVAEAAARRNGGDFFSYWRSLIGANRADGSVTADEWLAALTAASGDPRAAGAIRLMLESGVERPSDHLAALFAHAGVPHERGGDGRLILK